LAEIKPIRAWRYNETLSASIEELTSPLFDVVSEKQRKALYQNKFNSIYLSVPQGKQAADKAAELLKEWKEKEVLKHDKLPAIYVYYQLFRLAGSSKEYCRKGFICNIRAYDWHEDVILRHENTIPSAVNDRIELLEKTKLNVSPTHGLYTDENHLLEHYMDEAIAQPLYEAEDYQGVRDVLAVIHDVSVIRKFISVLKDKKVILADGHHRYESSLAYRKKMREANATHTDQEGYNFHLMYLTNTESDDLRILPTHRLVQGVANFNEENIIGKLKEFFIIKKLEDADTANEVIIGKKHSFVLLFKENAYTLRLQPEKISQLYWPFPDVVKNLDLTILHYFIIEKVLGIAGKEQRTSLHVTFDRSFSDCLAKVIRSEAQMAIITNEISIEDVKNVCASGFTMPQKSTYFYPKVICGFVFSSVDEDEFHSPIYSPF
jgi:uncharacterized protein (DUF1015 family)